MCLPVCHLGYFACYTNVTVAVSLLARPPLTVKNTMKANRAGLEMATLDEREWFCFALHFKCVFLCPLST